MEKRVIIAGGTGLVGSYLARRLVNQGAKVQILTRTPRPAPSESIQLCPWTDLTTILEGATAVINLAGEGIADQRWSASRKSTLLESRITPTRLLVKAMATVVHPPPVLVNASAIGIYGTLNATPVDEHQPPGKGFLAEICQAWEAAADEATTLGVRVVKLRFGVVLARKGGALPILARPIRSFAGTALGSGRQGFSWIHIEDLVRLILETLENPLWEGVINATAPHPCSNAALTRQIAKRLHRPIWPVPGFATQAAVKLLVGEMAETMLLGGAFVVPAKAMALGFQFRFPVLAEALDDLL